MFIFLIIVHIIASIFLIAVILLQAGRGEGLAESFGGGSVQTIFGTKASTFLARATTTCAIIFILTSLVLDIVASRYSKSVVEKEVPKLIDIKKKLPNTEEQKQQIPVSQKPTTQQPAVEDKEAAQPQEQTQQAPASDTTSKQQPLENNKESTQKP
ncbi:MAG: preprotein translocase subunit SecG [Candidatus Omnitrophica bacterium]|nr:preprotein translocase subunit SecG [Candidatus Omnitrophota bacterium]